ncbi:MAG: adenylate/guanylate cyclase domain-containing protein, partial [Casimicrobiaceae bacterium]
MGSESHTLAVTFVFTDIEGSTRLWDTDRARMAEALARHDKLCRDTIDAHGGRIVKMTGDGMHAAFSDPAAALSAALDLQRAMVAIAAQCGIPLKMRCGLHAGVSESRDNDYFGGTVNRAARIMGAAHGGQILVSQSVVELAKDHLPEGTDLVHLGRVRLRDLSSAEDLWQLLHPDLPRAFPALRSLEVTPNNLPLQLTSFIGRERELIDAKELLGRTRLLTLVGAGGIGKTRFSLQLAAAVTEDYPDGAWFVELASVADARMVVQATATVL